MGFFTYEESFDNFLTKEDTNFSKFYKNVFSLGSAVKAFDRFSATVKK